MKSVKKLLLLYLQPQWYLLAQALLQAQLRQ